MKVGDYVRTKEGLIFKIININDFREPSMKYGVEANYFDDVKFIGDEYLEKVGFKSSPNIIDLIEEDDILKYIYNQKEYVSKVINRGSLMLKVSSDLEVSLKVVEIKSIVTKEQFESMKYKLGK